MNYKRSLIGVLVVGAAGLFWALSSDHVRFQDIVFGPLHNHDEPVIIEDGGGGNLAQATGGGTLSIDFDLNKDTSNDPGTPILDDEIVSRSGSHPVVRVRTWVDGTEQFCGANRQKCMVEDEALSLVTNTGHSIDFLWAKNGHGLAMHARGQKVKRRDPALPSVFTVENPDVRVRALKLKKKNAGWTTYPLRTADAQKISVHLCFLDDPGHCDDYSPK